MQFRKRGSCERRERFWPCRSHRREEGGLSALLFFPFRWWISSILPVKTRLKSGWLCCGGVERRNLRLFCANRGSKLAAGNLSWSLVCLLCSFLRSVHSCSDQQEGHFEVKGNMNMAVEPDVTYGILTDYENNPKIFKTVSKVEVEHRDDSKLVTQHAHWNLLFWSGGFDMKMKVLEDHSKRAISYKLWVFLKILFYKPCVPTTLSENLLSFYPFMKEMHCILKIPSFQLLPQTFCL